MPADSGEPGAAGERKTRKIRLSDHEREVLIRTLEAQLAAAPPAERDVLRALLEQVQPKRRSTTQRSTPVFQVRWRAGGKEHDCGHVHTAHLEATDCVQHLAARGITANVVPVMRDVGPA